jgi:hypothetical protein
VGNTLQNCRFAFLHVGKTPHKIPPEWQFYHINEPWRQMFLTNFFPGLPQKYKKEIFGQDRG